tara:strand:+ start:1293 stop:1757 length:465 start_codon:yes stop_codon:yes gene_type:complete
MVRYQTVIRFLIDYAPGPGNGYTEWPAKPPVFPVFVRPDPFGGAYFLDHHGFAGNFDRTGHSASDERVSVGRVAGQINYDVTRLREIQYTIPGAFAVESERIFQRFVRLSPNLCPVKPGAGPSLLFNEPVATWHLVLRRFDATGVAIRKVGGVN